MFSSPAQTGPTRSMAPPEVLRAKGHTDDPSSVERRRRWPRLVAASLLGSACITLLSFGPLPLLRRTVFHADAVVTDDARVPGSAAETVGDSSAPRFPGVSNRSAEAESLPSGPLTNAESAARGDGSRATLRGHEAPLAPPPHLSTSAREVAKLHPPSDERPARMTATPRDADAPPDEPKDVRTGSQTVTHLAVRRRAARGGSQPSPSPSPSAEPVVCSGDILAVSYTHLTLPTSAIV